ncbi:sigma-70 family RNA polymerase sigma factor [Chryseolinea sp. T2]|uniref:RNA polymerase sigma factor n=1 Tax=Chryseolinea sp. T2 TaxID=3129255 RepID=UPI0030783724
MRLKLDHPEDEIERWNAMRHGDALSFQWLYLRNFQPLYSFGKKIGVTEEALLQSIHDVFADLWFYHENLSETHSVKLYLFRSWRRKINRHISSQALIDSLEALLEELPVYEDNELRDEAFCSDGPELQAQTLRKLINDLSPRQYEALVLRCHNEFNYREIAEILDINEGDAESLVERGLSHLKKFAKYVMTIGLMLIWSGI